MRLGLGYSSSCVDVKSHSMGETLLGTDTVEKHVPCSSSFSKYCFHDSDGKRMKVALALGLGDKFQSMKRSW